MLNGVIVLQKREVLIAGTRHDIDAQTNIQVYSVDQYNRLEDTDGLKRLKLKHVIIHDPRSHDEEEDEDEEESDEGVEGGESEEGTPEGSEEKPASKRGRKPNNQQQQ